MRDFDPYKYIELIENTEIEAVRKYMSDEIDFFLLTENLNHRCIIDLGAGYGRLVDYIASNVKNGLFVEINEKMFTELSKRVEKHNNSKAVLADITNHTSFYPASLSSPLFLLLQNSLGTIEGSWVKVLEEINSSCEKYEGDLIISFLRSNLMTSVGVEVFVSLSNMVGNIDYQKSDLENGYLVTDTGYTAKWWSDDETVEIISLLGGRVVRSFITDLYMIHHISHRKN